MSISSFLDGLDPTAVAHAVSAVAMPDASSRVTGTLDYAPEPGLLSAALAEIRGLCPDIEDMPGKLDTATLIRLVPETARPALRRLGSIFAAPTAMASICENYFSAKNTEDLSYQLLVELFGPAPRHATRPERLVFAGALQRLVGLEPGLVARSADARDRLVADLRDQGLATIADELAREFAFTSPAQSMPLGALAYFADLLDARREAIALAHPSFKSSSKVERQLL